MMKLDVWKRACAVLLLFAATAIASSAQTLTVLYNFTGADGEDPQGALIQGFDGNLCGTTAHGGQNGAGTAFKITTSGTLTTLHNFTGVGTDGASPNAGLVQAFNGNLYGTTYKGGAKVSGTIFKMTPSGAVTTLYSFCSQSACVDGSSPVAPLVQAANGNLYGTTYEGGANNGGTVFKITPRGALTTLYSFCSQIGCTDGENPAAGLVQAANGSLYGTARYGGAFGGGTIFKITPSGTLTTLHGFDSDDGEQPFADLVQAADGNLYGATAEGGANGGGTVFKITPSGTLTMLYSFCSQTDCRDGDLPEAGLIQTTDGSLYGTALTGGASGDGTIFKITRGGALTTIYNFAGPPTDGAGPEYLVQDTNGNLYGGTGGGGPIGVGTVFSLSVGLGPFVKAQPTSGKVGASAYILGTNLTGATAVTFNGTAASFTVVSATEITTSVPTGATTGFVTVTTPSGTLTSNKQFRVQP